MTREQFDAFNEYMDSLLSNEKIERMSSFIQHGNVSCLEHCKSVAYYSAVLAYKMKLKVDMKSLIRGALLHDYFLYDWHDKDNGVTLHGFKHPFTALKNAEEDYDLTFIEKDIIKKHMWPLTIIPPKYKESFIVCLVDDYCTIKETFSKIGNAAKPVING